MHHKSNFLNLFIYQIPTSDANRQGRVAEQSSHSSSGINNECSYISTPPSQHISHCPPAPPLPPLYLTIYIMFKASTFVTSSHHVSNQYTTKTSVIPLKVLAVIFMHQLPVWPRNDVQFFKLRYETEHSGYADTPLTDRGHSLIFLTVTQMFQWMTLQRHEIMWRRQWS
jgi:hypothetical protein